MIIAGSRTINHSRHIVQAVKNSGYCISAVISGTANGADKLGEEFAIRNNIEIERYPANWDKYGKRAGYLRNVLMAEQADCLIAVWDGKSKGTKHMINIAKKHDLDVYVYHI